MPCATTPSDEHERERARMAAVGVERVVERPQRTCDAQAGRERQRAGAAVAACGARTARRRRAASRRRRRGRARSPCRGRCPCRRRAHRAPRARRAPRGRRRGRRARTRPPRRARRCAARGRSRAPRRRRPPSAGSGPSAGRSNTSRRATRGPGSRRPRATQQQVPAQRHHARGDDVDGDRRDEPRRARVAQRVADPVEVGLPQDAAISPTESATWSASRAGRVIA